MPTIQQILKGARKKIINPKDRYLKGCPQVSGTVLATIKRKPKKPNSAQRATVKLRLSNGEILYAFVPGEKHNLQTHSKVLIGGGRRKDLVGVEKKVIRGVRGYDCAGVKGRSSSRSRYGVKRARRS